MRRILLLALLICACLLPRDVSAQAALPITPDPATCHAESIDVDALIELAERSSPAPGGSPEPSPTAKNATPEELAALIAPIVGSLACTNANQPLRALAYFTTDYLLTRISSEPAVTLGHLRAASTRQPDVAAPKDRVTIEAVDEALVWQGAAHVATVTSSGGFRTVSKLGLVETSDGWKIDVVLISDEAQ